MRKRIGFFIASLFCVLLLVLPVHADSEGDQLRISMDFGIYYAVKSGRYVPVHIAVEKVGEFTEGTLLIRVPVSSREQYVYTHTLTLKQRGVQEINFYIPVYADTKYLQVEVTDQNGKTILRHKETMMLQNDYGEVFTGILDRLENDESRLNNLIIDDNSDISIKEFHITTDTFPEHVLDLNMMDVIIVNPSAEKVLTRNKKKVLEQWVDQGGICVYNESARDTYEIYGNGGFYHCSEDLFQKDEESLRGIFLEIIDQDRRQEIESGMMTGMNSDYWEINELVNASGEREIPSLSLYMGLLLLYMASICPIAFWWLRKKKKSIYYGYHVAVCAFLFSLFIFLAGSRTRIYDSIIHYCKMVDLRGDTITEHNYVGVRSPNNKENEVAIDASYTVLPIQNGYSHYINFQRMMEPELTDEYDLKIILQDDYNILKIRNKKAFDISLFHLEKNRENTEQKALYTDLHIFDNLITGQVSNQTGKDLEDVFIAGCNQFFYIGSIKQGETITLSEEPLTNYTVQYFQIISDMFAKHHVNAVSYFLSSCFEETSEQFKVAGFMEDDGDFLGNGGFTVRGMTLASQNCQVDFTKGEQIYIPVLEQRPAVISGNYRYKTFMMESESCVVNYSLGADMQIDSVTFYENDCTGTENSSYRKSFSGRAYFMNWETGHYEEVDLPGQTFTAQMLSAYLNDSNQLQVKYVDSSYGDSVYSIGIPYITVTGRK